MIEIKIYLLCIIFIIFFTFLTLKLCGLVMWAWTIIFLPFLLPFCALPFLLVALLFSLSQQGGK